MTLASRPSSRSSTTSAGTPAGRPARNDGASSSASSVELATITPLPAARPSALRTAPSPSAASSRMNAATRRSSPPANARAAGHRHAGRRRDLVAERLGRLEPRGLATGPNTAIPAPASTSATPAASGASGPDDDEVDRLAPARAAATAAGSSGSTGTHRTRGSCAIAGAPRRDDDLVDARLARQLPGERVLAPATADDEDPGGHGQGHRRGLRPATDGRRRVGRNARSMVWVRSGPTLTSTIGTFAWSSSAVT